MYRRLQLQLETYYMLSCAPYTFPIANIIYTDKMENMDSSSERTRKQRLNTAIERPVLLEIRPHDTGLPDSVYAKYSLLSTPLVYS